MLKSPVTVTGLFFSWSIMQNIWLALFSAVLIWSGINPHDYPTWGLEVFPAVIALVIIIKTKSSFPLTPLLYLLVLIHAIVLMIGGHYTYAEVPGLDWLWQALGSDRNNYDKIGHFMQGFVPAIAAREILLRFEVISNRTWLNVLIVSFCLAFSAFYEIIEWGVALVSEEGAEAFLGTQGYVWDTQSDMALALVGAMIALVLLSRLHDRQLASTPST
jgi:putative membrane protein